MDCTSLAIDNTSRLRLGEGRLGESNYRHVYADSRARFDNAFGSRNPIRYGDRLFARLLRHGRMIMEFVINEVSDFTELMGELRKKAKGLKGLVQLQLRNYSRGWSMEQPLMLYSSSSRPSPRAAYSSAPQSQLFNDYFSSSSEAPKPERRMLFPWETH